MTPHTPGPWRVCDPEHNFYSIFADGRWVADYQKEYWEPGADKEAEANGRLIAAAPDLLEVLTLLQDGWTQNHIPSGIWAKVRAAIAKATGEA